MTPDSNTECALVFPDLCDKKSFRLITWENTGGFFENFWKYLFSERSDPRFPPWHMRETEIDRFEWCIRTLCEKSRYDSFILLWCQSTCRIDERSSFFEELIRAFEEFILELCFFIGIIQWPEAIRFLIWEEYSPLSRTWCIEEDTIKLSFPSFKIFSCIGLDSLDNTRSLESSVVHEFVISDLILFESNNLSHILHEHSYLRCLGSWSCANIENPLSSWHIECKHGEHTRNSLEIDLTIIKCSCPLDSKFMHSIKDIYSRIFTKFSHHNSFFCEFSEYVWSICLEMIESERSLSLTSKYLHHPIIFRSKKCFESRYQKVWKHNLFF